MKGQVPKNHQSVKKSKEKGLGEGDTKLGVEFANARGKSKKKGKNA